VNQGSTPSGKHAWRSPEIIDVGDVTSTTMGGPENVGENPGDDMVYYWVPFNPDGTENPKPSPPPQPET
jgi:hypothetical protein